MNIEDLLAPGDFSAPELKNSPKYPNDIVNKLLLGNSLEIMHEIPDNSIDLIPTDPPYGISFMSKGWDHVVPSVAIWQECLRILKPGAFAFIMSSPRQDVLSQMIVRLTQAGFDTGFSSIYWTYASGFPKALNISKAVDEKLGYEREVIGNMSDIEPRYNTPRLQPIFDGNAKSDSDLPITASSSPEAKALDGSYGGLQLKPAIECIIQVQKPLDIYSILTITISQCIKLIDKTNQLRLVKIAESNLHQQEEVKEYIVQQNAMEKIIEEATVSIGKVAKCYDLMDTLKYTSEEIKKKQYTSLSTVLLWKIILADLLGKVNKFTIETVIELITELKTLNCLIFQNIQNNITHQKKMNQSGSLLNVNIVESFIKSVLLKLQSQKQITALKNVGSMNSNEEEHMFVHNVIASSEQITPKENIVHKNVINSPEFRAILVAMKPLNKPTFVEQALYNKHGITWLDDCRIPIANGENIKAGTANSIRNGTLEEHEGYQRPWKEDKELYAQRCEDALERANKLGRFPANILVSGNILDDGKEYNNSKGGNSTNIGGFVTAYSDKEKIGVPCGFGDSGSFSRYFSLDAWWDKKVKELPENIQKTFPFLIVAKPSKGEKNEGLEDIEAQQVDITRIDPKAIGCNNPRNRGGAKKVNFHPTVKSIKLFSYLITLGSREGDIILDPFAGSGTTSIASIILNRKFIAIEISPEYYEIADARIALALKNNKPNNKINLDDLI